MSTIIGRVRPVFRGEWDPASAYAALDMVRSADGQASYTALKDVPAGTALSDATYWDKIVDMTSSAARPLPATAEGNPAQIWPDAGSALRPVTTLAPVQSGSGDPSPDNVRPISGRTGVGLTRCGKNLLPAFELEGTVHGISYARASDGGVLISGTATERSVCYISASWYNFQPPAGDCCFSVGGALPAGVSLICEYSKGDAWQGNYGFIFPGSSSVCFQTLSGMNFGAYVVVDAGTSVGVTLYPQLELGSTATAYEPYQGDTCAADFGQTVYGGALDWATGVLTVTHEQMDAYAGEALPGEWISDRDVYAPGTAPTTGAQVVYELATPTTLQLTPRQIAALPGLNTLFTNGDGLSVGYNKSIARMFEEVLALIPAASGA